MKLKVLNNGPPVSVVKRFPHLELEIHKMAMNDESFRQLCQDYKDLVRTLKQVGAYTSDTKSDLLGLKATLEVEILEQVSRESAAERH